MITNINEFRKFINESNRYFDEHDSVDDYEVVINKIDPISKGEYDEHRLTVTGMPDLRSMNTRNGNWEEMLYFVAKYSKLKDDEFADYIKELPLNDEVTIIDDNQALTFSASDLNDFSRGVNESNTINESPARRGVSKSSAGKPSYKIIAKKSGIVLVDVGFRLYIVFESDLEKLAANNFKDANLMNNYFTGTAILGKGKVKSPKTTDYSSPFHKGQVIDTDKFEDEDAEEVDFTYDRQLNNTIIEKLLNEYIKNNYVEGLKIIKMYLH